MEAKRSWTGTTSSTRMKLTHEKVEQQQETSARHHCT